MAAVMTCPLAAQQEATATAPGPTPPIMPKIQETPLPPVVVIPPPPEHPTSIPDRPINADEAAAIALHEQPMIAAARGGLAAAAGRARQARGALFPTLSLGAAYTKLHQFETSSGQAPTSGASSLGGGVSSFPGYQANGTIKQLLFDFGHSLSVVRQFKALERAAGSNLSKAQSDLVLQVKQAFYTYIQNQRLIAVNESNVHDQLGHLALAKARLSTGLGTPADVVRAEAAVADAVLNLNLARTASSTSAVLLASLMGVDPRTPIKTADTHEGLLAGGVEELVLQALGARPEVLAAEASVRAGRSAESAARTSSAPTLGASVGVTARGQDFPPSNDFFSIGASIQWDIFDAGLTAGRVKEARGNLQAAQAQLASVRLQVTSEVAQAFLKVQTAQQRITTSEAGVVNARESVRLATGRYESGVGTFIDVIDAQSALLTAETNRVNAESEEDQARAALRHAVGATKF